MSQDAIAYQSEKIHLLKENSQTSSRISRTLIKCRFILGAAQQTKKSLIVSSVVSLKYYYKA